MGSIRLTQSTQRGTGEDGKAEPGGRSDWTTKEHDVCSVDYRRLNASQKLGSRG